MYKNLLFEILKPFNKYVSSIEITKDLSKPFFSVRVSLVTVDNKLTTCHIILSDNYLKISFTGEVVKATQEYDITAYKGGHLEQLAVKLQENIRSLLFTTILATGLLRTVTTRVMHKLHLKLLSELIDIDSQNNNALTLIDGEFIRVTLDGIQYNLTINDGNLYLISNVNKERKVIKTEAQSILSQLVTS